MTVVDEFHDYAELCLRMAEDAHDATTKAAWERLARKWQKLEREEAKRLSA
jgi:hypothetical protein